MISVGIHTNHVGQELQARTVHCEGTNWVQIRSGEDDITIFVGSPEHAQRIADACNWRQEPEPMAQPIPVPVPMDVELSPVEVVMASSLDCPCAPLEVDDDTPF